MYIATSTKPPKLSAVANILQLFFTKEFLSRQIVFENLILERPLIYDTDWQKEGKAQTKETYGNLYTSNLNDKNWNERIAK